MHQADPVDAAALFAPQHQRPLTPRERSAVLARISALIEFWGITPEDLARDEVLPACASPSAVPYVKYRHPVTGETWDGQGLHPEWMRRALLKEGYRVEELKPTPDPQSGEARPS
jgi:DNA-binding protein H-NS